MILNGCMILTCMGYSQAQVKSQSNTCEGFPVKYTVVKDDWLSKIAQSAYMNMQYSLSSAVKHIGDQSGIENLDLIFPGQVITIPCPLPSTKIARRFVVPEFKTEQMEVPVIVPPEIRLVVENLLPIVAVQFPTLAPPETTEETVIAEQIEVVQPFPTLVPTVSLTSKVVVAVKKSQVKKLFRGLYQTLLPVEVNLPDGRYSALVVGTKDAMGRWRHREKTSMSIHRISGVYRCVVFIKNPKISDVVVFKIDGMQPLEISLDKFSLTDGNSAGSKLAESKYTDLDEIYPAVPKNGFIVLKSFALVIPPVALTYFSGGILPATIAGGTFGIQRIVLRKARREEISQSELNKQLINKIIELEGRLSVFEARDKNILAKQ